MRHERIRLIIVILTFTAILCTGAICAGCAGSAEDAGTQPDPVILTVLAGQTAADAGTEDMINDLVADRYPYVTLDWQTVEWGNEFDSMLRADFAAGEIPDIIIGKAQDVSEYYRTGNLAEIDGSLTKLVDPETLDDVSVGDKIYGLPYNEDYLGVIYNKKIFRNLKLSVPSTSGQMQDIVRVIEESGQTPFAFTCMDTHNICTNTMQFMMNEIFKYNSCWGDDFRLGKVFFDQSAQAAYCFENNRYIMQHSWDDTIKLEQYECETRFAQGSAAMYVTRTGEMSRILQESGDTDFGIFPYPNANGDASLIRETDMTFMKSGNTENSDLVDDILMTVISDKELTGEIAEFTQKIPVIEGSDFRYGTSIQDDIDRYEQEKRVIDSIDGYEQLSWSYMDEITEKQIEWLEGYTTLDKVLYYAELKRPDSFSTR